MFRLGVGARGGQKGIRFSAGVIGGCEPPHKDAKTELKCSARTGSSLNR